MKTHWAKALPLITLGLLTGCEWPFANACTSISQPGLRIELVDAQSGAALASLESVRVVARDGAYADTTMVLGSLAALAHERPGTYSVTIEHPDYRPWSQSGIRVREGDRHVQTESITARLERTP